MFTAPFFWKKGEHTTPKSRDMAPFCLPRVNLLLEWKWDWNGMSPNVCGEWLMRSELLWWAWNKTIPEFVLPSYVEITRRSKPFSKIARTLHLSPKFTHLISSFPWEKIDGEVESLYFVEMIRPALAPGLSRQPRTMALVRHCQPDMSMFEFELVTILPVEWRCWLLNVRHLWSVPPAAMCRLALASCDLLACGQASNETSPGAH